MDDNEFSPSTLFQRIRARWWIPLVLAVCGGLIGLSFQFLQPKVYESTVVLSVMMNFTQQDLTQFEQDDAFNNTGEIINSTNVYNQLVEQAKEQGITVPPEGLRPYLFLEGKHSVWELHVRGRDANFTTSIANLWSNIALEALNNALRHALQEAEFRLQSMRLAACLPEAPGSSFPMLNLQPVPKECTRYTLDELQEEINILTDEIQQEKSLTQGVLPSFEFTIDQEATIPPEPLLPSRAVLVLAGAWIGVILSIWVAGSLRISKRG